MDCKAMDCSFKFEFSLKTDSFFGFMKFLLIFYKIDIVFFFGIDIVTFLSKHFFFVHSEKPFAVELTSIYFPLAILFEYSHSLLQFLVQ